MGEEVLGVTVLAVCAVGEDDIPTGLDHVDGVLHRRAGGRVLVGDSLVCGVLDQRVAIDPLQRMR